MWLEIDIFVFGKLCLFFFLLLINLQDLGKINKKEKKVGKTVKNYLIPRFLKTDIDSVKSSFFFLTVQCNVVDHTVLYEKVAYTGFLKHC